jgi:hypothetical protein
MKESISQALRKRAEDLIQMAEGQIEPEEDWRIVPTEVVGLI